MIWNGIEGKLAIFLDGYATDNFVQDTRLKTQLPSGKSFRIVTSGSKSRRGTLTQLNLWDYEISSRSVTAMSAGGLNVHGSVLSWRNLAKYVSEENIQWGTDIYLPGKKFFGFFKTL